ncbi:hypothetical protein DRE_00163 [Drechslerella stenobrocha 248]|uniref:Translation initiation factor IF2/IF5 domain-containing protein n=1 Tax=Drechslerella stenobrocha 248 TaxID=1043628 RepID=W7I957_9PEZI|nr:hypothetical protein DRE_00163 [Drechslerella stenobrocha 248]
MSDDEVGAYIDIPPCFSYSCRGMGPFGLVKIVVNFLVCHCLQQQKSVAFGETTNLENGEKVEPVGEQENGDAAPATFDPSAMKKKKKPKKEKEAAPEDGDEQPNENGDATAAFDPKALKKKKSKKSKEGAEGDAADGEAGANGEFDPTKLKKTKKSGDRKKKAAAADGGEGDDFESRLKKLGLDEKEEEASPPQTQEEVEAELQQGAGPWAQDNTVPFKYTQLLKRFYINLYEDHPELSGDGRLKNYKIPPPQVVREGNKKSIFHNLPEIARKMKRNPDHVIQFIFAELGTNGSVDGSGRLVIKGRFQQKQLESVLRRYIVEYLTCGTCKSPNTTLNKENRLFFVSCNVCGSRKSVSAIKTGFQAALGKRRKMQT